MAQEGRGNVDAAAPAKPPVAQLSNRPANAEAPLAGVRGILVGVEEKLRRAGAGEGPVIHLDFWCGTAGKNRKF
ncbi:hypothetical protein GGTG_05446 [Gaeumannomyces tritici R3-111a-1]|uniref:Uncharacterized protein n=1 Tax=Gaeumannomyces tritici (strain R3-111a-1) TaxID=644352 RepID=J3NVY3_GAET3|nr:hypothetical protein GGTG_05446 [Gaeumannomyces tritici R3-111a-1]EJT75513.1 hypothetical protein GGTG_05446 [Gaeumannomyces tritici R3-111a-1]